MAQWPGTKEWARQQLRAYQAQDVVPAHDYWALMESHARLRLTLERIAVRSDVAEIANLALDGLRDGVAK